VIPTWQPANFSRVYAACGGVLIALSVLWGWGLDGARPDRWDAIGSVICILGTLLIMFAPRH